MSADISPSRLELLTRAAARVANDGRFIAWVLRDWAGGDAIFERVAQTLGCDTSVVVRLALCCRPRSDPAGFRQDVARIAASAGIAEERLAAFLREAEALAAFREPVIGDTAMLAAARDLILRDEYDATDE